MTPRTSAIYLLLAAVLAASIGASVLAGTCGVPFGLAWRELSAPRLAMGMLAGAGLSMAGAMFQSLFRNPLASPYTLGISSGASLGAALAITWSTTGLIYDVPIVSLCAFFGAIVCVGVVYAIAHWRQATASTATLLLAGVSIGFVCSALIVLVMFLSEVRDADRILRWMMGSLEIVGFDAVYETLAIVVLAAGIGFYLNRELDLLMLGEVVAQSRGVHVVRTRRWLYLSASLLTAAIVAYCGPIGFVGLLVPHAVRYLLGSSHHHVLPGCALAGAAFLPLCDMLARNAMYWIEGQSRQLPVGVLTNLLGGLFFLYLLLRRRGQGVM